MEVDGSLSVEDLLSTLMKQLKGSDWLKEAAEAANAALLNRNDGRGDGDDVQDVILKKVEEELKKEEK